MKNDRDSGELRGEKVAADDRNLAAKRPSPGKRTLTMSMPGAPRAAVQMRTADRPARSGDAGLPHGQGEASSASVREWTDVVFRPDRFDAPANQDPGVVQAAGGYISPPDRAISPSTNGGGGRALPEPVQAKMERSFGADFSAVRVHEGNHASEVGALAYAQGTDIHFAPGQYQPGTTHGQELLGHELAHVIQQSQGRVQATEQMKGMAVNGDPALEREADIMGARAARGEPAMMGAGASTAGAPAPIQRSTRPVVQRVASKDFANNKEEQKFWNSVPMKKWLLKYEVVQNIGASWNAFAKEATLEQALMLVAAFQKAENPRPLLGMKEQENANDAPRHAVNEYLQANEMLDEDWVLTGYLGTSTIYEKSILAGINPPKEGTRDLKGEQLGYGLYVSPDIKVAEHYALEQHTNQKLKGQEDSEPLVLRIYVKGLKNMKGLLGIPVDKWWKQYPEALDKAADYLESPVSGHEKDGWHQIKYNEHTFPNLKAERGYVVETEQARSKGELHEQIVEQSMSTVKPSEKAEAILMMGGPGAGKSTLIDFLKIDRSQYVQAGPDEIKAMLPEYQQGIKREDPLIADKVHNESKAVSQSLVARTVAHKRNLLYDGTGSNSSEYNDMIGNLHAQGYKVRLLMCYVAKKEGLRRVAERAKQTGRDVPELQVMGTYDVVGSNFLQLSALADDAALFDNSDKAPVLAWSREEGREQLTKWLEARKG